MKSGKEYVKGLVTGLLVMAAVIAIINMKEMNLGIFGGASGKKGTEIINLERKTAQIEEVLDDHFIFDIPAESDGFSDLFLKAYVARLGDPYTAYMSQEDYVEFSKDTEGRYAGVGIQVMADADVGRIVVVAAFDSFPAAEAGVLPGDQIYTINGEDFYNTDMNKAVEILQGETGTTVDMGFYRTETDEIIDMVIERKIIDVPTVKTEMHDKIGYLSISQFGEVTTGQFKKGLTDLKNMGMEGLVVDLRNNPGGQLDVVTAITEELVGEGLVVYMVDKKGDKEEFFATGEGLNLPLVVLVNKWSASASEVLTGAVKDLEAGVIVGENTFGKGIVQRIYVLGDKSAIKVTVSEYFSPNGTAIHDIGIAPDVAVELPEAAKLKSLSNLTLEEDTQLTKALEIIEKQIN